MQAVTLVASSHSNTAWAVGDFIGEDLLRNGPMFMSFSCTFVFVFRSISAELTFAEIWMGQDRESIAGMVWTEQLPLYEKPAQRFLVHRAYQRLAYRTAYDGGAMYYACAVYACGK